MLRVAVTGCLHGELDRLYKAIEAIGVDLVLVTGDFQAVRDNKELDTMAVPNKYKLLKDFEKYFSGECKAPVLTVFVGGNHEAPALLLENALGGWVAPNIYFLGIAGVVRVAGVRIAGVSGIFSEKDFHKLHFEQQPFDQGKIRSVYHTRDIDIARMMKLSCESPTIFLSHDWPLSASQNGDQAKLLRRKPFFRDEVS
jgi:lariat debranching enzyme